MENDSVVKTRVGYVASLLYSGDATFCRDKGKAKRLPSEYAQNVAEELSYLGAEVEKA